jgi:porin
MKMADGAFFQWLRLSRRVAWYVVLLWSLLVAIGGQATAQDQPDPSQKPPEKPGPSLSAISGNPASTTFSTAGIGWLGRTMGLKEEWGVQLGGVWLADTNLVAAGGAQKGNWSSNSALFVGLYVNANKLVGWEGAAFGAQLLQLNAANTNGEAGSVQGYNGIVGSRPYERTELFQLWYAQEMIKDVLKVRIGRSTPSADFNNVLRPVTFLDKNENIPAVSGLLYSPVFVNGSILGAMPGYYNSGDGVTVNFAPTQTFYVNLGAFASNLARGQQTGQSPPHFNGYWFNIGEIGTNWQIGDGHHPGQFAIGLWHQTGVITKKGVSQDGMGGFYMFASQRLAHGINPAVPSSAITSFVQFGANNSETMPITQYYGAGLTAFGLIGNRDRDSFGVGMALSKLNPLLFQRPSELMFQAYYQAHIFGATFLQPTVSLIPTPGAQPNLPMTVTTTLRLTVLF